MKYAYYIGVFIIITSCAEQPKSESTAGEPNAELSGYDSLLAQEVGADPYGMRQYVFAYLKAGPNRDQDSLEAVNLQKAHLENIGRMAKAGKLVLAGPFMDNHEVKGIYIFAVESMEEARELTNSDPAVQAGRLIMELHPWYGTAAMMKLNEWHSQVAREQI